MRGYGPPVILVTCIAIASIAPVGSAVMVVTWLGTFGLPFSALIIKRTSPIEIIETYNENIANTH